MTLTDEQIAELQALLAKMTPGPWLAAKARSSIAGIPIVSTHEGQRIANCSGHHPDDPASYISQCLANAAGIVALVNAAEPLLAEVLALRKAIKVQASAVRTLQANEETEVNRLRKEHRAWHQAVSSLDSEREANALLTAENEAGRAEIARLEADYNELTEAYAELLINGRTEAEMREAARAGMQAFHKRRAALKGE